MSKPAIRTSPIASGPASNGAYVEHVTALLGCTVEDARKIKVIMTDHVLHTVALDWLTKAQFASAARKASKLLTANRAEYDEYFAGIRASFERDKIAQTAALYEI